VRRGWRPRMAIALTADGTIMAVNARSCTGRRLLHAKQADGCALRGTVAGVNSHPRGLN
jgi:hypothetical protein